MSFNTVFSVWLDQQLEKNGITGKELASLSGVSEATISRIKNGKVALSPRVKGLLAKTLRVTPSDIPSARPSTSRARTADTAARIKVLPSTIPVHATLSFAAKRGLFSQHNIIAEEIADWDLCASYAEKYMTTIQAQLADGQHVLAMGHKNAFSQVTTGISKRFYSHTYTGYAVITRAKTDISTIEETPPHNRLFALRVFLETLEDQALWADPSLKRFSWISTFDLQFLSYLKGMADEITKGIKYSNTLFEATTDKPELESLYGIGNSCADFALTDAKNMARVYAEPSLYKVVLSFEKLKNIIINIPASNPPSWSKLLMPGYRADKASTAIERFKAFWLEKLSELEIPVYWHLLSPPEEEPDSNQLSENVANTLAALKHTLADPLQRNSSLTEIQRYVTQRHFTHSRLYGNASTPDFEYFRRAWGESFSGL